MDWPIPIYITCKQNHNDPFQKFGIRAEWHDLTLKTDIATIVLARSAKSRK